jgi:hypothetical protein
LTLNQNHIKKKMNKNYFIDFIFYKKNKVQGKFYVVLNVMKIKNSGTLSKNNSEL